MKLLMIPPIIPVIIDIGSLDFWALVSGGVLGLLGQIGRQLDPLDQRSPSGYCGKFCFA